MPMFTLRIFSLDTKIQFLALLWSLEVKYIAFYYSMSFLMVEIMTLKILSQGVITDEKLLKEAGQIKYRSRSL